MSHSTVNDLIRRGKRIASWQVNEALISALNGSPEALRQAWVDAYTEHHPHEPLRDGDDVPNRPAPRPRLDELIDEVRAIRALLEKLVNER